MTEDAKKAQRPGDLTGLFHDTEPPAEPAPDLTHWLVVVDEWDEDGDMFEVEHDPLCPRTEGDGWWDYDCHVGFEVSNCGIDAFFIHRDDPEEGWREERVRPGRHRIEPWNETYNGLEFTEYDSGLRLVEPTPADAEQAQS